ncbi:MAG: gliding motility-associated C-terminal domain-containing protein, partial [Saprospiraceae bacterium]
VCIGGVVVLQSIVLEDFGNSMATYTYHSSLPPDTTNLLDATYWIPPDSTTIYVLATAASGMCFDTLPIKINVQDYPDFTLQGLPCDFIANTYSVLFTSTADSIHTNFGTIVNNPVGQDAINGIPNDSTAIIELISASGLCRDTVLIVAPNCNCPNINQPVPTQASYSICEDVAIPVLTVTVDPGLQANWYDVPSGGTALLSNSLTYQPPSAISANFYVESYDPANTCYSIRTQIPLTIYQLGDIQSLADPQLCEAETLDFTAMVPGILNGVPGTGQWFDLSTNLPVSGIITPQNGDSWYYLFTSNPGDCQSSDTLAAVVNPLPFIDVFNIICDDVALSYDLQFTSNADALLASVGSITNILGTDTFHLDDIPFDTDVQFSLEVTASGCTAALTLPAPNCSCPALLDATDHEACSDQGNLNLSTFVGAGVTGTWQMVSTPAGANPATLSGSNFQGANKDDGVYVLRFIRSIILANCVDTAAFSLTLNESPFADAGTDGTSCAPDQIILSGTANVTGVQTNWQTTGTGSIANPNSLNTNYTPTLADITAGSVNFTLTTTDPTGACPNDSETITIDIDGSAYFILNPTTLTNCDTSDINVDLDDLVSFGTTGGTWFFPDTVSAPITGSSTFNPSDLMAGSYTVFYTTSNAVPPCENDTVGVTLIIENCACPSVALSTPNNDLCSDAATQNLNTFLITTEQGNWTIVSAPAGSKPAVITGYNFVTNGSDACTYTLRFTLSSPVAGCASFADLSMIVVESPTAQVVSATCATDLLSWVAIITTTAEDVSSSSGTLTSLGNNQYLVDNITVNTNLQITIENGNGLCSDIINISAPDCDCTLDITNLPVTVSLCPDDQITLQATVTGGKGAVTSFWINGNDTLHQTSLDVDQSGTYRFVSTDELGCKEERSVDVDFYTEMVPDVNSIDINCPGDNDGRIIIEAIAGGTGPYSISVNNGPSQTIGVFPFALNNLSGGNYQIEFTDASDCIISISVPIQSASSESIDLGPDQVILVGDSVFISPSLTFVPDSFFWTGDITLLDPQMLDKWISPDADQTFTLSGVDAKGCLYSDDLTIRVLLTSNILVPNVFSPNDDGFNDFIAPSADPSVVSIEYFEIFSRWGELVYSAKNFTPGDAYYRWDGMRDNKPYQQAVYAYRLSATNKRGKILTLQGDITLIR